MRRRRRRRRRGGGFESRGEDGARLSKFVREGPRSALASRRRRRGRVGRDGEGGVEFHREPVEQRREVFGVLEEGGGGGRGGGRVSGLVGARRGVVGAPLEHRRGPAEGEHRRARRGEGPRERVAAPARVHRGGGEGRQPAAASSAPDARTLARSSRGSEGLSATAARGSADVGAAADASAGRSATRRRRRRGGRGSARRCTIARSCEGHRGVTRAEGFCG